MGRRVEGIDVARGVASIIMIQGHAYHGWVAPEHHDAAYRFTRVLGTLPLPSFLVLAGAAVAWRIHAGIERGEAPTLLRRGLLRRGLQVVAWGYGSNLAYACIDGHQGWDTLLRAEVLSLIGLCIIAAPGLAGRTASLQVLARRSLGLGILLTLLCPLLAPLGGHVEGPLRYLIAPLVDVPGVTRMPVVPLFAWFAIGVGAARFMLGRAGTDAVSLRAGTDARGLALIGSLGLSLAALGGVGTDALLATLGGSLSRAHLAVWPNVLDGAGRGLVVLAAGASLSLGLPRAPRRALVVLGQTSLIAYVVHVPFCYGRLGGELVGRSTMGVATMWLVPLALGSVSAALAWHTMRRGTPRKDVRPLPQSVRSSDPRERA